MYTRKLLIVLLLSASCLAQAEHELDGITIEDTYLDTDVLQPSKQNSGVTDAVQLLKQLPGTNVHQVGPLSGQVHHRGLFGFRNNVQINDIYINSGGPNWMDPPLHYAPKPLLDSIEVQRGIPSISTGSALGGYVNAKLKTANFTESSDFAIQSSTELTAHSVDEGYNIGTLFGLANNKHRVYILGSRDEGNDSAAGDGDIEPTEYERDSLGGGYGYQSGKHEFLIEHRYVGSKDTGTPVLPLDIDFFHTDISKIEYKTTIGAVKVEATAFHTDIEHRMNNFELRETPDISSLPLPPFLGPDARSVDASSDGTGTKLALAMNAFKGEIKFGVDTHYADHDATVTDPDFAPFFVTNFENSEVDQVGAFIEWRGDVTKRLSMELGTRYTRVKTDTDEVDAFPAQLADMGAMGPPAAVQALRDNFNASDRSQEDDNLDAVLKFNYQLNDSTSLIFGAARNTRSPSYVERYVWIPLNINAGLGDGNNYVGDPDLDHEWATQFELGVNYQSRKFFFSPRIYHRHITNFIQGVAVTNMPTIAVSGAANGDPTPLQFANTEADIWGFDAEYSYRFNSSWQLDGTLSLTRGRNDDLDDDLYHIAADQITAAVKHIRNNWSVTLEGVLVDEQDRISDTLTDDPLNINNNNDDVPGYGLVNLYADYQLPGKDIIISGGIENLFDKDYVDALSGFNRVINSDVDIGDRLPGTGFNLFTNLSVEF